LAALFLSQRRAVFATVLGCSEDWPRSWSGASSTLGVAFAPGTPFGEQAVGNWNEM
jgi:hypothetical protein